MSEYSNHINYTAADIEKYWKGNLSAAEMHAMEKAALDDPFLADAMEGYREPSVVSGQSSVVSSELIAGSRNVQEDIAELRTRLQERISEGDKKAPVIAGAWWKIAASVIVVAGVVWLYQLSTGNSNERSLAKQENTVADQKKAEVAPSQAPVVSADSSETIKDALVANDKTTTLSSGRAIAADSMTRSKSYKFTMPKADSAAYEPTYSQETFANVNKDERKEVPLPSVLRRSKANRADSVSKGDLTKSANVQPALQGRVQAEQLEKKEVGKKADDYEAFYKKSDIAAKDANTKKPLAAVPPTISKADTVAFFSNAAPSNGISLGLMNTINGLVVTPANQPVPFATVKIPGLSIATQTDQNGLFSFKTMDTTLDVAVTNVGYQTQNYTLRNNYSIGDNRIVLQPANNALNDVVVVGYGSQKQKAVRKTKDISVKILDAEPSVGWNEYNEYLEKNKKIPDSLKDIHGDVVVNFDIDSKGLLKNYKIEKSLNDTLDEEAIRLVKYGPTWRLLKGKKTKVSVIVKF